MNEGFHLPQVCYHAANKYQNVMTMHDCILKLVILLITCISHIFSGGMFLNHFVFGDKLWLLLMGERCTDVILAPWPIKSTVTLLFVKQVTQANNNSWKHQRPHYRSSVRGIHRSPISVFLVVSFNNWLTRTPRDCLIRPFASTSECLVN